jgi:carbon storage regulator
MLVITRREGEEVVIGDPRSPTGVVRIASIKGDRVRVAFDFPRDVEVHRREVANQIIAEGSGRLASTEPVAAAASSPR